MLQGQMQEMPQRDGGAHLFVEPHYYPTRWSPKLWRSLERDKDYLFGFRYTPSTSKQEPHQSLRRSDTTALGCMCRRERLEGGTLQNFKQGCTAHLKKFLQILRPKQEYTCVNKRIEMSRVRYSHRKRFFFFGFGVIISWYFCVIFCLQGKNLLDS